MLNLVNKETSEIKYEVSHFPDGQSQVKILANLHDFMWIQGVEIKARLNNFKDLEIIMCATASLRELGVPSIRLYTPYVLGARSDRKFEGGSNNYLKSIMCPLINRLQFNSITVLDPHSDCLEMGINRIKKVSNIGLVHFTMHDLYPEQAVEDKALLISPDAGASKKIYKLADQIGYKGDIITCSKDRDNNGKLTATVVPLGKHWTSNKDAIIIDDICDGGATFINIVKQLKANGWKNKIYLIVTHGIFSKGFEELSKYFDDIYCTNSYRDIKSMSTSGSMSWLKQLNIF